MSAHTFDTKTQEAYIRESYFAARIHAHELCADLQQKHGLPRTPPNTYNIPFTQVVGVLAGRMFGFLQAWGKTGEQAYLTRGFAAAQRFEQYYELVARSTQVAHRELKLDHTHPFVMHAPAQSPQRVCPHTSCYTELHLEQLELLAGQN
ncbi:hypothetical protein FJZ22_00990 [Candidatus Pacearchaeota archaeon]|nr:hypothetical protein [Candidatus Pacearchaeota archaeon]